MGNRESIIAVFKVLIDKIHYQLHNFMAVDAYILLRYLQLASTYFSSGIARDILLFSIENVRKEKHCEREREREPPRAIAK